jgi:hypothetical protein
VHRQSLGSGGQGRRLGSMIDNTSRCQRSPLARTEMCLSFNESVFFSVQYHLENAVSMSTVRGLQHSHIVNELAR